MVPCPSQVKVDKSCALEHVTRDRVRGGQRRRPPTRVHLKEVGPWPQLGKVGSQMSLGPQLLRWQRAWATFFLSTLGIGLPEWHAGCRCGGASAVCPQGVGAPASRVESTGLNPSWCWRETESLRLVPASQSSASSWRGDLSTDCSKQRCLILVQRAAQAG